MILTAGYLIIGIVHGVGLFVDALPEFDTPQHRIKKMFAVLTLAILAWPFFLAYEYHVFHGDRVMDDYEGF